MDFQVIPEPSQALQGVVRPSVTSPAQASEAQMAPLTFH